MEVRVDAVELRRVELPLVAPFRAAWGVETVRSALLVRVLGPGPDGWGECVAMRDPGYSAESVDAAEGLLRTRLVPLVVGGTVAPAEVAGRLAGICGHPMAKAALELAVLDAGLRAAGQTLAAHLGGTRTVVDAGVSVGLMDSEAELLDAVAAYLEQGYRRVKLKIVPGRDVGPVAAVRARFGDDVALQVDANGAYRLADADHLAELDAFDLLLIEQPLADDDLTGHAELGRRLRTPICLDESITSAAAARTALALGACRVINIKAGRVGGYLEARRVHDVCVAAGAPAWCGGMLETGLGRAANVALASLPGFTLPGDLSASDRYFRRDLTAPFVLRDGQLTVPQGPGLGVEVDGDALAELTSAVTLVRAGA